MRIALATCRNLPDWEVDDLPLHRAFEKLGVDMHSVFWDDPDFDWAACDSCLIRTTWDYMERREEFVEWAARISRLTQLFNPPEIVRWNTHKGYLRDLEKHGIPTIPTVWIEEGSSVDLKDLVDERGWTRGILKPQIGATARETLKFETDPAGLRAARAHLERTLQHESMMLQPYLESVETRGEVSVILLGGEVSHVVQKIPAPGDYRVQHDFGGADRPTSMNDGLTDLVARLRSFLGEDLLYARIDSLLAPDGNHLLIELELVEPSLFFRHSPDAAEKLALLLRNRIVDSH